MSDDRLSQNSVDIERAGTSTPKQRPLAGVYEGISLVGAIQRGIALAFSPSSSEREPIQASNESLTDFPTINMATSEETVAETAATNDTTPAVEFSQDFKNKRALALLLQQPVFTGHPGVSFDDWSRHLDNILTPTNWPDAEKIRALASRLHSSAYDVFQSVHVTNESYKDVKKKLHDRYHGHETANHFQQQLETRVRRPGETTL